MWKARLGIPVLIAIGMLLTVGVVHAALHATHAVYAYDVAPSGEKYQSSNVVVEWYGEYVPFWHRLNFDDANVDDLFPWENWTWPGYYPATDTVGLPTLCPGTGVTNTYYEGVMEYGLYHEDNNVSPVGGAGFQETRSWELVSCDRDGDGDFDVQDRTNPYDKATDPTNWALWPYSRTTLISWDALDPYANPQWVVLEVDRVDDTTCGGSPETGNCRSEIITTIFVNIDSDCDQDLTDEWLFEYMDAALGGTGPGLCFYAEAQTPIPPYISWELPLQARISAGGGDKTVTFKPTPPTTAVDLSSFTARWLGGGSRPLVLWAAAALLAGTAVGAVTWQARRGHR